MIPECPGTPVVLMRFGSHLYGTDTPSSDVDWKGVFLPTQSAVLLGTIPKAVQFSTGPKDSKNAPGDVDAEWYSLHYFLKLAAEGQTVAMDMLHAPDAWPITSSPEWAYLREHRREFHTKNLRAFVGYCRRQAAKYGVKGSRLAAVRDVVVALEAAAPGSLLADAMPGLVMSEHVHAGPDGQGRTFLEVCGRKLQDSLTVEQALGPLRRFAARYGERAEMAASNDGIDWKAVSHALRAAHELLQIYRDGDIRFPLANADHLREVKRGALDFTTAVGPELDRIMEQVEAESLTTALPESVNVARWNDWLVSVMAAFLAAGAGGALPAPGAVESGA